MGLFRPLTSAKHSSLRISALLDGSQSGPGELTWVSAIVTYHRWEGTGYRYRLFAADGGKPCIMSCQIFRFILLTICEVLTISYWVLNHLLLQHVLKMYQDTSVFGY